ncbi:hypothetical protein [Cypionkella sp.]|uniref:hypothetical protein n=1 Tax=Cypionkella sp. TaxID=2811411 RepID=UPI0037523630
MGGPEPAIKPPFAGARQGRIASRQPKIAIDRQRKDKQKQRHSQTIAEARAKASPITECAARRHLLRIGLFDFGQTDGAVVGIDPRYRRIVDQRAMSGINIDPELRQLCEDIAARLQSPLKIKQKHKVYVTPKL